jgi:hypothetical protein
MDAPAKAGGLGLLLSMGRKAPGEEAPAVEPDADDATGEQPEAEVAAASDVKSAMAGGSDEDFARALARFVRVCRSYED